MTAHNRNIPARAGAFWLTMDGLRRAPRVMQIAVAVMVFCGVLIVYHWWFVLAAIVAVYLAARLCLRWLAHRNQIPYGELSLKQELGFLIMGFGFRLAGRRWKRGMRP